METKKKTGFAMEIVLIVCGCILLCYGVYTCITAVQYVVNYLTGYGEAVSDNLDTVIPYVITQCINYLGIGVLALGGAQIIRMLRNISGSEAAAAGKEADPSAPEVEAAAETDDRKEIPEPAEEAKEDSEEPKAESVEPVAPAEESAE